MNQLVTSPDAPKAAGAYSPGIVSGGFLFVAGQGPFDSAGALVGEGDFAEQLRQTFRNLEAIARAAGTSLRHTVRLGVYLKNMENWQALNELSKEFLAEPYPARTTIQADLNGFEIEADVIVALPDAAR
ncbi:Rid family detoxifying hydrolase [Pseudolysinimonas kribbensis]|uniref:Reactive intermediate/imine deaminase n=1 Tax=Pseudolysinimonas kribbensis TaxID=433641 RepID=A0ABQ6K2T9_9MICO|nr:RidA family protein [Pseudolysinimonas kribbensis]GMA94763.1 reactive intermediate/imine deaminase [Pseudolysinimonas kribbensis]